MKTIYHSKNNRLRNRAVLSGILVVVVITIFIVTGIFSRTFYRGMVILSGSTDGAGQVAASFSGLFSSKASLARENADLRLLIAEKEAALADRAILAKENSDLKAAEHFKDATGHTIARILSKPPFTPFDVLVVDAGSSQGIKLGDRVMLGQTFLGTVTLVSSNSSQVTLLSSPTGQENAFVGDASLPIILRGKGGGNFETSLPQGSAVIEGDLVFTYYLQTPLYIGTVSKVVSSEDNTLMNIFITLPVNLYSLSNVEIIPS